MTPPIESEPLSDPTATWSVGRVWQRVRTVGHMLGQVLGVPDYEAYVRHRQATHPGEPMLSREAFYRNRQAARYGAGQGRCC